jgi:TRAP-type transport system periplasmic protein
MNTGLVGKLSMLFVCSVCVTTLFLFPSVLVAQTASPKNIELKYASAFPEAEAANHVVARWLKELEQRTGGKVRATLYYNELLGKQNEMLNMLKTGVCDIALISFPAFPGMFPITDVIALPYVAPDLQSAQEVLDGLFKKGLLAKEFAPYKVLWLHGVPGLSPTFRNQKITTLEELKGKKIRVHPGVPTKTFKALGAVPIGMSSSDLYMALERGTVDGAVTAATFYLISRMFEVTKYFMWTPVYSGGMAVMMSKDRWNSLPADIRAIMEELSAKGPQYNLEEQTRLDNEAFKTIGQKVQAYDLSPQELKRWQQATQNIVDEWIAEMEANGLPGREAVKVARDIAKKRSKK